MQVATNKCETPKNSEFGFIAETLNEQLNRLESLINKIKGKVNEIHSTPNNPSSESSLLEGGAPSSSKLDMTTILKNDAHKLISLNNRLQDIHSTLEEII